MVTREELLKSKEFWLARLQSILYEQVEKYLKDNNISKTEFASKLGVSKGYISQILNGDFDHKVSKFIELSLAIDKAPLLKLEAIDKCVLLDSIGLLDSIQENAVRVDISINFSKPVKIEKPENLIPNHGFKKKLSPNYRPYGLKQFEEDNKFMTLA